MVHLKWRGVLKSVSMRPGEPFVTISGVQMMEMSLASSLVSQSLVCDHGSTVLLYMYLVY